LVEDLGFDSIWLTEHRFWYDGWCPQPVLVAGALAAVTSRLRIGTAVHLVGQHDPRRAALTVATVAGLSAGRLELGVGLGYRDEEFDGIGVTRRERVRLLRSGLDALAAAAPSTPVWVGGMADAAIIRAARRGLSLLLPPGVPVAKARRLIDLARTEAAGAGTTVPRVAIMKDVWAERDGEAARAYARERLGWHYREYASAWWGHDANGRLDTDRVVAQIRHGMDSAIVGTPDEVLERLLEFVDAGVDSLILQVHKEETRDRYHEQLELLSASLVPRLRERR
jgi:alkanesulfonate monooxygenase SsuD/methylene tetrahydromethanopterin reductase-like flavin-dependent oxidoreductase (luciferase family)